MQKFIEGLNIACELCQKFPKRFERHGNTSSSFWLFDNEELTKHTMYRDDLLDSYYKRFKKENENSYKVLIKYKSELLELNNDLNQSVIDSVTSDLLELPLYEDSLIMGKKLAKNFPLKYKIQETEGSRFVFEFMTDAGIKAILQFNKYFKYCTSQYIYCDDYNSEKNIDRFRIENVNNWNTLEKLYTEHFGSDHKWNIRFLNLAKTISSYSKDPSTKVGAVVVDDDDNVRTIGYNGFPRGVNDTEERLNDRSIKYPLTVHAELNAISTCARVGIPTKGSTMVCTHFPCATCAGAITQSGFKEVVVIASNDDFKKRWEETNKMASIIFSEGGVNVIVIDEDDLNENSTGI